ncbi:MAG: hypothetical protein FWF56_01385 [Firmicutes bacterium]|nr:hypothetical protein [Bacillota bacterium]MCL1953945.1 hypothetical protein [Bacillota bacterium]
MEVIKQGNLDKIGKLTKTCSKCDCEFVYEKQDVQIGKRYYSDTNTVRFVSCPTCLYRIYVSVNDSKYLDTRYISQFSIIPS